MNSENTEHDPVTVTDKRRVDPETGQVRGAASGSPSDQDAAGAPGDQGTAGAPGDTAFHPGSVEEETPAIGVETAPETHELAERTADLQRVTAEYANYRRRVERDRQSVVDRAKASVVSELLVVVDDLERARVHGDLEAGPLKSVADKITGVLTGLGLAAFGEVGDKFDPELHEAVHLEGDGNDPVIGEVLRKGYRLGELVLRHAMVSVTDNVVNAEETAPKQDAAESEQE